MKLKKTKQLWVLGIAAACAATTSSALTLGKARGAILLGQPLSLTVAIQTEGDEAAAELCFDADVYYGENRQESSHVAILPLRTRSGAPTAVRVTTTTAVDEPIVTVYLRAGCGVKTSRKYVLLSDLVSDLAPITAADAPVATVRPQVQATAGAEVLATAPKTNPVPDVGKVRKSKAPSVDRLAPPRVAVAPGKNAENAKVPPKSKPRLKLSILDLVDIKDPDLKISNELSSLPSDDPGKRDAASALWRSLNKSSEDILKDEAQQKLMAEDVKSLKEISSNNRRDLAELGMRLERAESQRYANPVTYSLLGLLLLLVAAVVFLLGKLRGGQNEVPWWRTDSKIDHDEAESEMRLDLEPTTGNPLANPSVDAPVAKLTSQPLEFSNSGLDIDLGLDDPAIATPPSEPQPVERKDVAVAVKAHAVSGVHRDLSHSLHASLYAINTQEMLDVRQQADFFMTLGQHEEAISLLEGSIRENESSNPLVYLDLLKVLHTLSRKPAFDFFRAEFNGIFTGRVQSYATFGQPGNTLDAYPQICSEITELWGTEGVVDFLEQCMVRRPEDAAEMYFDLDAFRDLLTLHAVASRLNLNSGSDSGLLPFSAVRIPPLPELKSMDGIAPPTDSMDSDGELGSAGAHAVDFDISTDKNLIDFDASGLSVSLPPSESK